MYINEEIFLLQKKPHFYLHTHGSMDKMIIIVIFQVNILKLKNIKVIKKYLSTDKARHKN